MRTIRLSTRSRTSSSASTHPSTASSRNQSDTRTHSEVASSRSTVVSSSSSSDNSAKFTAALECHSVTTSDFAPDLREQLNKGGKCLLPPHILESIMKLESITFPMIFKVTNREQDISTHTGVYEFSAGDGRILLPDWTMKQLGVSRDRCDVTIEYVELPKATYAKLQPLTSEFFDVADSREMLETFFMMNFSCLSERDEFVVDFEEGKYPVRVVEVEPAGAVNIIDCDLNVDLVPLESDEVFPAKSDEVFPAESDDELDDLEKELAKLLKF